MRCTLVQNYRNNGIPRTLFHFANNLKHNCDNWSRSAKGRVHIVQSCCRRTRVHFWTKSFWAATNTAYKCLLKKIPRFGCHKSQLWTINAYLFGIAMPLGTHSARVDLNKDSHFYATAPSMSLGLLLKQLNEERCRTVSPGWVFGNLFKKTAMRIEKAQNVCLSCVEWASKLPVLCTLDTSSLGRTMWIHTLRRICVCNGAWRVLWWSRDI